MQFCIMLAFSATNYYSQDSIILLKAELSVGLKKTNKQKTLHIIKETPLYSFWE